MFGKRFAIRPIDTYSVPVYHLTPKVGSKSHHREAQHDTDASRGAGLLLSQNKSGKDARGLFLGETCVHELLI